MRFSNDDKQLFLEWSDIEHSIANFIGEYHEQTGEYLDPDTTLIIGLTRGGLTPAVMLSHATGCPMHALDYSSNRGNGDQKRPNDAFPVDLIRRYSTIFIVDEIVDTGHTMHDLTEELNDLITRYAPPNHWVDVFTFSVVYKEIAEVVFTPTFHHVHIAEELSNVWVVFPWEVNPYVLPDVYEEN